MIQVGYKKSIVFLYTNSEQSDKKTIPFKIGLKTITNLRINLRKDTENNKILMRKIKEDLNQWRVISCL